MHLFGQSRIALMIFAIAAIFLTSCSKPAAVATSPPPPPPPAKSAPPPLDEVIVTGSKIPPRGGETAAPRPPISLPEFPWPPPKPSSRVVLPTTAFNSARTFGDLTARLDKALSDSGYSEKSYWNVPDGIAEVMRLERTYADGRPADPSQRWVVSSAPLRPLSLSDYIRALFTADPGYYRVVAFVVTDVPFAANGAPITESGARALLANGAVSLPPEYLTKLLPTGYNCTALVYEFFRETGKDASELDPGHLDGKAHLVASGIWSNLHLQ